MRVYVLQPHTITLKFLSLTVRKIWHILCVCVSRPVTLTFDILTLKLVRNVARVMRYPAANFGDATTVCFFGVWPLDQHRNKNAQSFLDTVYITCTDARSIINKIPIMGKRGRKGRKAKEAI